MGGKEKIKHTVVKFNEVIKPIKMKIKDLPQIIEIYKSYWGERGLFKDSIFKNIIQQNLSYVYKINDEIIGFCLMEYLPNNNIIEIALLCIKEEYKSIHLGKTLLSFCINYCISKNYKNFSLHVSTKNIPALRLYEQIGFTTRKLINNYYNDEDPKVNDAYYMTLNA